MTRSGENGAHGRDRAPPMTRELILPAVVVALTAVSVRAFQLRSSLAVAHAHLLRQLHGETTERTDPDTPIDRSGPDREWRRNLALHRSLVRSVRGMSDGLRGGGDKKIDVQAELLRLEVDQLRDEILMRMSRGR